MSAKPMEVVLQTVVYLGRFYKNDEKKEITDRKFTFHRKKAG